MVKTMLVLEAIADARAATPLGRVATLTGLTKPTAHRILAELAELGYVERGDGGVYGPGVKLTALSGDSARRLETAAMPAMTRLYEVTGETVNLGVLRGRQVVYLRVLESTRPLRRVAEPDAIDPWYCTALGRTIVARLPASVWPTMMDPDILEPRTDATNFDPPTLERMLQQTRRRGYAIETDETDLGVTCIGAAVLDEHQHPLGAISVSVPTARIDRARRETLIHAVCDAAEGATNAMSKPMEPIWT